MPWHGGRTAAPGQRLAGRRAEAGGARGADHGRWSRGRPAAGDHRARRATPRGLAAGHRGDPARRGRGPSDRAGDDRREPDDRGVRRVGTAARHAPGHRRRGRARDLGADESVPHHPPLVQGPAVRPSLDDHAPDGQPHVRARPSRGDGAPGRSDPRHAAGGRPGGAVCRERSAGRRGAGELAGVVEGGGGSRARCRRPGRRRHRRRRRAVAARAGLQQRARLRPPAEPGRPRAGSLPRPRRRRMGACRRAALARGNRRHDPGSLRRRPAERRGRRTFRRRGTRAGARTRSGHGPR